MKNLILVLFISSISFANSSERAPSADSAATAPESFRCEKNRASDLAAVKGRLIENCNLNKPYSVSYSDAALGADGTFFYCCHKR